MSDDIAIAATMNAETIAGQPGVKDAPVGSVVGYLLSRMLMDRLEAFVTAPPQGAPAELVTGLHALLMMVQSPHVDNVAMTDPVVAGNVKAILTASVAVGLMTQQNADDLLALGVVPAVSTPWWQSIGAPAPLNEHDIARAREA